MKAAFSLCVLGFLAQNVVADMYMQTPPGANNRLDERNRDRNNGNRLCDTQNNDRGGYNVGKLSFYVGEQVPIMWTNQHGSGTYQMKNTEVIIQYMCDQLARDGTTTSTIPDRPSNCANFDCDTDVEYGRHESYTWYQYCKATYRNMGLFTANQNLKGTSARYTRQNPGGTRRGYECPEERDYYPYWRATMWKDIAIYTNQVDRCDDYQSNSENTQSRSQCVYTDDYWNYVLEGYHSGGPVLTLNQTACEEGMIYMYMNSSIDVYEWRTIESWDIAAPDCNQAIATRANHHGLTGSRQYWTYEWTVPNPVSTRRLGEDGAVENWDDASCCVLRLRYNITTNDYPAWLNDEDLTPGLNATYNAYRANGGNVNADQDPANYSLWENFRLEYSDISASFDRNPDGDAQKLSRGYVFRNNPRVDPFGRVHTYTDGSARVQLQLAINTNQFGRTFQDRSHCFQILPVPDSVELSDSNALKLITVQGKRGNIVQVYPATEYFFMPEPFRVRRGDWVHFCWTGSNTNPNNNDGQGDAGTDRSNICPMTQAQYSKDLYSDIDGNNDGDEIGDLGNSYPDYVDEPEYGLPDYYNYANIRGVTPSDLAGFDLRTIKALCTTRRIDFYEDAGETDSADVGSTNQQGILDYGNMEELDHAGTTFCIPPVEVNEDGEWNFLSTRNNNFSNRSQKGTMIVSNSVAQTVQASSLGGVFETGAGQAKLVIQEGMIAEADTLEFDLTTWMNLGAESTVVEITGPYGGEFSTATLNEDAWLELWIPYTPKALHYPAVEHRATTDDSWSSHNDASIEYDDKTYYAVTNIDDGGFYKVVNTPNGWALTALFVGVGAFVVMVGIVLAKKCKMSN